MRWPTSALSNPHFTARRVEEIPVILNPTARSAKASGRAAAIRELSPRIRLCETAGPGDARRLARELSQAGAPLVVAAGGDGTVNEVVNGLADLGPDCGTALGILPAGTMNVFAVELGLPAGDLAKCWRIAECSEVREVDLWKAGERYFVQLAGVGLDAQVIAETTWEKKKALGPLSYAMTMLRLIGQPGPELTVTADERPSMTAAAVLLGNGHRYGGPLKIFPRASNSDGLLDVLVLKRQSLTQLAMTLSSLFLSRYRYFSQHLEYFQARRVTVSALQPVPVEADGDLSGATPVVFEKAPWPLRVVC